VTTIAMTGVTGTAGVTSETIEDAGMIEMTAGIILMIAMLQITGLEANVVQSVPSMLR